MRWIRSLTHALMASDGSGLRLVLREWQRYLQLPRQTRGSYRAAAGVMAHWHREFALVLLIVVSDHPFMTASVLLLNLLGIALVLLGILSGQIWT